MLTEINNNYEKEFLLVEYFMGNLCNHRCSYCFPGSNEGTQAWPDIDTVGKNIDHLLNKYKDIGKTNIDFYLIGGEPTLYKDLGKLCTILKEHKANIRISTNGSRGLDWWQDNIQYFDQVEVSVHHEYCDVDHLINVCDLVYSNDKQVVANILMDPDNFGKCLDIIERFKSSKYQFPIISKVVHYNGVTRYNNEQLKVFDNRLKRLPDSEYWERTSYKRITKVYITEDNVEREVPENYFTLNNLNKFFGWTCNLGVDYVNIGLDGTLSGNCKQRIYNEKTYYNLYDIDFVEKFNPIIEPIKCMKTTCECTHEITIKKHARL